jgi:hypothetical protein
MDERTNILRGVAFCARLRDLHGLTEPDPSHRCELCGGHARHDRREMSAYPRHRGRRAPWQPLHDPALWLGIGVAAPYVGMLAYFVWWIGRSLGIA